MKANQTNQSVDMDITMSMTRITLRDITVIYSKCSYWIVAYVIPSVRLTCEHTSQRCCHAEILLQVFR